MRTSPAALACALALTTSAAQAGVPVRITIEGNVTANQLSVAPLAGVQVGEAATVTFLVDSETFTPTFPPFETRGYLIDESSFELSFASVSVGLPNPFPGARSSAPLFVVSEESLGGEGFFTSTSPISASGVPLELNGTNEPFVVNEHLVAYTYNAIKSLDILAAVGTYTSAGASNFLWGLRDGTERLDIDYTVLKIEACGPAPTNYCTAGTSASGCWPSVYAFGTPSATAASGFTLNVWGAEGKKSGLFYFGSNGRQATPWGNGTSYQCVAPPVRRGSLLSSGGTPGSCDGTFTQDMNALWCPTCPKPAKNPGAGAVVQAQLWYRDPQNTSDGTTTLSDATEFTVCP
jgi:hypothetical protein